MGGSNVKSADLSAGHGRYGLEHPLMPAIPPAGELLWDPFTVPGWARRRPSSLRTSSWAERLIQPRVIVGLTHELRGNASSPRR